MKMVKKECEKYNREHIQNLNLTPEQLEESKTILKEWDLRLDSFYKGRPSYVVKADKREREHLRNAVKYYEEKFKNETE